MKHLNLKFWKIQSSLTNNKSQKIKMVLLHDTLFLLVKVDSMNKIESNFKNKKKNLNFLSLSNQI